jgi:hypothetical protein
MCSLSTRTVARKLEIIQFRRCADETAAIRFGSNRIAGTKRRGIIEEFGPPTYCNIEDGVLSPDDIPSFLDEEPFRLASIK